MTREKTQRANLGGGGRTAVEGRVRRRRRRSRGEERIPVAMLADPIPNPISRFVRNRPQAEPFRYGDKIHVSDLVYKCMRMVALAGDLKVPVPVDSNWHPMKLIHHMGEAAHNFVKGKVIEESRSVFGHWRCGCEATRIGPMTMRDMLKTEQCDCGMPYEYDELTLTNDEYSIVGNCDLAVQESGGILVFSELKSISKKQFDQLSDAKPDHKMQLLMYVWMAQQAGYEVHPSASVFYVCREWMIGTPYKEFVVDISDVERRVSPLLREAMAMKQWQHEDGPVPDRTWCNRPEDSRAKKCGMCAECFLRG